MAFLAVAGLTVLVPLAVAYACIPLATVNVGPARVGPGQEVTVTGKVPGGAPAAGDDPVEVRLDTVEGPVLASVVPDAAGRLTGTFTFPPGVNPGDHVLLVGRPGAGADPARTVVHVRPPAAAGGSAPRRPVDLAPLVFSGLGALGVGLVVLAARRPPAEPFPALVRR